MPWLVISTGSCTASHRTLGEWAGIADKLRRLYPIRETEPGMAITLPHQFDPVAVAIGQFEREIPVFGQGMEDLRPQPAGRGIAQDAHVFAVRRDQLGRADQQREARIAAMVHGRNLVRHALALV